MATGYIGKSQVKDVSAASGASNNGVVLNYTCPATGVKYAVLTITASVSISRVGTSAPYSSSAKAGIVSISKNDDVQQYVGTPYSYGYSPVAPAITQTYTVVLGPGQNWTGTTIMGEESSYSNSIDNTKGHATLEASVLEVV